MRRVRLTAAEARRAALAAQGFDRPRPVCRADARHLRRVLRSTGVLQLDYVNVLMPAHFLVLWSRLGPYEPARFERLAYHSGEFTEQWAHEASIVPAKCWPLLAHRRQDYRIRQYNPLRKLRNRGAYLDAVLDQVQRDGAVTAHDLPPLPGPKRKPGDWHRSVPRWALEYHFARGNLAVAQRLPNFQRAYDLPERILPAELLRQSMPRSDAQRELLRIASESLGVATLHDLADYFRMSPRESAPLVEDLVEDGKLKPVTVDGWKAQAYLSSAATIPRVIYGASLLSPFDPIVWFRPRAERLFGFHYRIEIYVPASKRQWGYYVLPFRLGDKIVARVDLKADRKSRQLLVPASYVEDGVPMGECADALARELHALKDWLQLDKVAVSRHNPFSRQLAQAV